MRYIGLWHGLCMAQEDNQLTFRENSQLTIDVKSLVGILAMMLSVAGVYFTLTGQITQLQLDVTRLQDSVSLNQEFRIKWPRGELGALPDDAVQDLNIKYLQGAVDKIQEEYDEHVDEHKEPTK
tara:strand:- start:431 stop:802 length:372 start_codon:yes stop_codon:yes gene_type:complete